MNTNRNMSASTDEKGPAEKLHLLKSPLTNITHTNYSNDTHDASGVRPNLEAFGDRYGAHNDSPTFQRHEDASNLELLFDLFFAANYTVFSAAQKVTGAASLRTSTGYFCLLWLNWLLTGLYDVRFLTDSLFERAAKAVHLGVMVGFAVVAPHYDPNEQNAQSMRTMSLILFISRITLAVEYGSILWHVRKFKGTHKALYAQIGLHLLSGIICLGIAFSFKEDSPRNKAYIVWYVCAGLETLATIGLSNLWSFFSLVPTHLMKRMGLLTIIILGDTIIVMAENVATIVEGPSAWNPRIIGIITSTTATIYFVFLIYFDWMKANHLTAWRQQLWTVMHLPFHLALVLFAQGFNQLLQWAKIVDVLSHLSISDITSDAAVLLNATTSFVTANLTASTDEFFKTYPPKYADTWDAVSDSVANLTAEIPDDFWPQLSKWETTSSDDDVPDLRLLDILDERITTIYNAMQNAVFETFNVDLHDQLSKEAEKAGTAEKILASEFESEVTDQSWSRYVLIFTYTFTAAGCTLGILSLMHVICRRTRWKSWPTIQTIINLGLALALGLMALIANNLDEASNFLSSAWVLPVVCLVWFIVLVLTHAGHTQPVFFEKSAVAGPGMEEQSDDIRDPYQMT